MSALFDEGAGEFDSNTFQTKLGRCRCGNALRRGARHHSSARCACWPEKTGRGVRPAEAAVEQPRFDAALIDRIRAQMHVGHRRQPARPRDGGQVKWAEARLWRPSLRVRPDEGTEKSLATITADDLRAIPQAPLRARQPERGDRRRHRRRNREAGTDPGSADSPGESPILQAGQEGGPQAWAGSRVDYDLPQSSPQLA